MPIPAYQSILAELIHVRESLSTEPNIRVSIRFFKFLMQLALENRPFEEAAYLEAYPDVREAIARGAFRTAKEHFIAHGYFEGRIRGAVRVDEEWYPRAYPDVAPAIQSGAYQSATDHYLRAGVFEWRLPSADAFDEFDRWKTALLDVPPGIPPTLPGPPPDGAGASPEPAETTAATEAMPPTAAAQDAPAAESALTHEPAPPVEPEARPVESELAPTLPPVHAPPADVASGSAGLGPAETAAAQPAS